MTRFVVAFGVTETLFRKFPDANEVTFTVKNMIVEMSDPPTASEYEKLLRDANTLYREHLERRNINERNYLLHAGLMFWSKLSDAPPQQEASRTPAESGDQFDTGDRETLKLLGR